MNREAWQATVLKIAKRWTEQSMNACKDFIAERSLKGELGCSVDIGYI